MTTALEALKAAKARIEAQGFVSVAAFARSKKTGKLCDYREAISNPDSCNFCVAGAIGLAIGYLDLASWNSQSPGIVEFCKANCLQWEGDIYDLNDVADLSTILAAFDKAIAYAEVYSKS